MIPSYTRGCLKKVAGERPGDPQNCVVRQNIVAHAHFPKTFLMWAWFWHSRNDFMVGVAHPRGEIGS